MAGTMKGAFALPNEKISIEFIKKQRGNITNKKHVMYGGLLENSNRVLVPKKSRHTFKYERVLDKKEEAFLETLMGMPDGGLNPYAIDNNFWDTISVNLRKEGVTLDLSDPIDYIRYKIALQYSNTVAPSLDDVRIKNKQTYRFVIVRKGERDSVKVETYNVKKEAYKIADRVESDLNKLREFLYLMGTRVSNTTDVKWLKSKLGAYVEDEPKRIIEVYTSNDYTVRALLAKAVLSGVVKEISGRYYLEDGLELASDGSHGTLAVAVEFLASKTNADIRNRIEAKLG